MACPDLCFYIASAATLTDVGAFLGIDTSRADKLAPDLFGARERIGGINVWWNYSSHLDLGMYEAPWSLVLQFGCSYSWSAIRNLMVLKLCAALAERFPGTYLGVYDTCTVLFWLRDGNLVLADSHREYFSSYPLPFETYSFEVLPSL